MCIKLRLSLRLKTTVIQVSYFSSKPTASEVLSAYLTQCNEPPWTSYFVKVISSTKLLELVYKLGLHIKITRIKLHMLGTTT